MRLVKIFLAACLLSIGLAQAAHATVLVKVDKSDQIMRVYVEGELRHVWPVSTGRGRYNTPNGSYRPYVLSRYHRSRKYDNAPMPYSIFYRGGYAIHGTYAVRRLGTRASHGCVRLHIANARELYRLVRYFGKHETRIVIRP